MDTDDLGILIVFLLCCSIAFTFGFIWGGEKQLNSDRDALCKTINSNTDQYFECIKKNPKEILKEIKFERERNGNNN